MIASFFSHTGTIRNNNQDRALINGIWADEKIQFIEIEEITAFVADGVGGSNDGAYAATFVLDKLRNIEKKDLDKDLFEKINFELISSTLNDMNYRNSSTTLIGITIDKDYCFKMFNAGDSEIWLLRGDALFRINDIQVLDEFEDNSPITSYFGGLESYLNLDTDCILNEVNEEDVLIICSDGLMKAIKQDDVKSILLSELDFKDKSRKIFNQSLVKAPDNVSMIMIQV